MIRFSSVIVGLYGRTAVIQPMWGYYFFPFIHMEYFESVHNPAGLINPILEVR